MSTLARRDFLKGVGTVAASSAFAGLALSAAAQTFAPEKGRPKPGPGCSDDTYECSFTTVVWDPCIQDYLEITQAFIIEVICCEQRDGCHYDFNVSCQGEGKGKKGKSKYKGKPCSKDGKAVCHPQHPSSCEITCHQQLHCPDGSYPDHHCNLVTHCDYDDQGHCSFSFRCETPTWN